MQESKTVVINQYAYLIQVSWVVTPVALSSLNNNETFHVFHVEPSPYPNKLESSGIYTRAFWLYGDIGIVKMKLFYPDL